MKPEVNCGIPTRRGNQIRHFLIAAICLLSVLCFGMEVRSEQTTSDEEVYKTKQKIRQLETELSRLHAKLRKQLGIRVEGGYLATPQPLPEPIEDVEIVDTDGPSYPISNIRLMYAREHPGHPPLSEVMSVPVELVHTPTGFVSVREGVPGTRVRLWDFKDLSGVNLYGSAIRSIAVAIVADFNRQGIVGVFVGPDPSQINSRGEDLRAGNTDLTLIIRTAVISEVRSYASGERFTEPGDLINNPAHSRIVRHLPVHPADEFSPDDILNRDALDSYVARLNRHPSRRVDIAVSAASTDEPGDVALDVLVAENRPWSVYFQISNTGTENTGTWRERLGFVHNQLTNNDDILSIDYITSGFHDSHSVIASYEAPWFDSQDLRWRAYTNFSIYESSDVGFANVNFSGRSWAVGAEMIWNFSQDRDTFWDLVGGFEWSDVEVDTVTIGPVIKGRTQFFIPHIGVRMRSQTETSNTFASVMFKFNVSELAGTDGSELIQLGRGVVGGTRLEEDFYIMTFDLTHSFYLEPLLNRAAWEDTSTPETSTLAHELFFAFRGQVNLGERLPAQQTRTAGGMHSVRGYEESEATGDSTLIFTGEYRLHLPRLFAIQPDPSETPLFGQPFRWSPQHVYGRPDWDLMFRLFVDIAHTSVKDPLPFEASKTLLSTGVGVEFVYKRNLVVRVDWGLALLDGVMDTGVNQHRTDAGDSRVHIMATILY